MNNKGADQTAQMRRLVCVCVVREPPKTGFLGLRPILSCIVAESNIWTISHYSYLAEGLQVDSFTHKISGQDQYPKSATYKLQQTKISNFSAFSKITI